MRTGIAISFFCALFLLTANPSLAAQQRTHIGYTEEIVAKYEDTFVKLARDNDLGFVELRAANPEIDPWLPGAGKKIILPKMHILPDAPQAGIVINLPEMRLYFYGDGKNAPQSFPIGIGREGLRTPLGRTHVRAKMKDPTWRPTPRMRREDPSLPEFIPPGPDNPLGTHILYLGWPEYGIHGTDKPYGIGRRVSSGCIRMYPEDIITLYPQAKTDMPVTVVNQAVKAAWIEGKLYIEAHPSMEQANAYETDGGMTAYEMTDDDMREVLKAAGSDARRLDWKKVRDIIRERRGYPIAVLDAANEQKADVTEKQKRNGSL